ncbi:MAPEG family protein [Vitiosangium sp. GDMCC 1.1324]|uniref:MAPEG family protein n=1 Tax=Vitiosangium sp. (strain GDMCC 1.1324) TaxID=2138576 RepID=UPI00210149A0|nr:MAPEG family protein [Vitiosangium sp. GDMCC 1.1324]
MDSKADTSEAVHSLARKQRIVRLGIGVGLLSAGAIAGLAFALLPPAPVLPTVEQRVAFALRCTLVASWTLVAGILAVATKRFTSEAIDPLSGVESPALRIHARYLQNTLEQLVLFCIASVALATLLKAEELKVLVVATLVFVLGRVAFWIGYLKDPLLRIPGFNATFYTNVGMLLYATYKLATR